MFHFDVGCAATAGLFLPFPVGSVLRIVCSGCCTLSRGSVSESSVRHPLHSDPVRTFTHAPCFLKGFSPASPLPW